MAVTISSKTGRKSMAASVKKSPLLIWVTVGTGFTCRPLTLPPMTSIGPVAPWSEPPVPF